MTARNLPRYRRINAAGNRDDGSTARIGAAAAVAAASAAGSVTERAAIRAADHVLGLVLAAALLHAAGLAIGLSPSRPERSRLPRLAGGVAAAAGRCSSPDKRAAMCAGAHSAGRGFAILPASGQHAPRENAAMTVVEEAVAAPSFKRAALGFFGSTACLCLVMLALSSF